MRIVVVMGLFLIAGMGSAGTNTITFPHTQALSKPAAARSEIARLVLDADVFASTDDGYTNLRLFDARDREVPYHLQVRRCLKSRVAVDAVTVEVLNFKELPENCAEITVKLGDRAGSAVGLRLQSPVRNFEKQVTVYGSQDQVAWRRVAVNIPLYDYTRFLDLRNDTVNFLPQVFVFYKVEISNIMEKKDSPLVSIVRQKGGSAGFTESEATSFQKENFRIDQVQMLLRREERRLEEIETGSTSVTNWTVAQDVDQKATVLTLAGRRQPWSALSFRAEDVNFSRAVTVEAKAADAGAAWRPVAAGQIRSIHAGLAQQDELRVAFDAGPVRVDQYRVTIFNKDNPALLINGITAEENHYEVLFFPKQDVAYALFYGGPGRNAPQYDVAQVLSAVPLGTGDDWRAGSEEENPDYQPGAASSAAFNSKRLFVAALLIMVVALVFVVVRLVKKVERVGADTGGQR